MKIIQLEHLLDAESSWRKKEISDLMLVYQNNPCEVILKSIILLLYSHWEGFIKRGAKLYLKYIKESKVNVGDLCSNFKAIALKEIISSCFQTKESLTLHNEIKLMEKLEFEGLKYKVGIDVEIDQDNSIIDTDSNLTPKIFKNILKVIGLEYRPEYEAKQSHLNANFIGRRNTIAHGSKIENDESFTLDLSTITNLRILVFTILEIIQEEIIDHARYRFYLSENRQALAVYQAEKQAKIQELFESIS